MLLAQDGFEWPDWLVLAGYLVIVIIIGVLAGRRRGTGDDYFLAGRSMPMWAVAISVLATSQSAATFIGGPQQAYTGNLTYFAANLAVLIAVVLVAVIFIPAFYRHNVTSVYELLGHRFGPAAQRCASAMYLVGRVFAGGARLFIVALPFSLVAFGDVTAPEMMLSIVLIAIGSTVYTLTGGIRAVIWTDVIQAILYITTISLALWVLWQKLPLDSTAMVDAVRSAEGGDKLKVLDLTLSSAADFGRSFNFWAIVLGLSLLNLAAYGTDQDLTQRMLTCRSAVKGSWSVIVSCLIGWPVVLLFLLMGLGLYVFYDRPDLMGAAAPDYAIDDTRQVFLQFIIHEMPTGVRGLMMAGLFAAAMSSMDSGLNAMASTTIADFYRPLIARAAAMRCTSCGYDLTGNRSGTCPECGLALPPPIRRAVVRGGPEHERFVSRIAVVVWAVALSGFACFCIVWQSQRGDTLINFALSVMIFAYSGLLAVFLTALLTTRGSQASVLAALATGFVTVLLMQDGIWKLWTPYVGIDFTIAFPWTMLIATGLSFLVCVMGKR